MFSVQKSGGKVRSGEERFTISVQDFRFCVLSQQQFARLQPCMLFEGSGKMRDRGVAK
jgi:hypothetical protein